MHRFFKDFESKIKRKKIKIAIVGLGYVGLPLALEFAERGIGVIGIEIDESRLNNIKNKRSYITDVSDALLRKAVSCGRFKAAGDFNLLKDVDVIIICVPTPLKGKYHPDISYIVEAVKSIARHIRRGSLVILESTTYPGTTEEVILPLLEAGGKRHGVDFFLSFSPERIDPGNKDYPVHKIAKVVGGITKEATDLAVMVYKQIIDKVVPVSSARVAEAVKLLENTFRLINIGLIDELAMMAHKMNIDIWEVVEAAATKPFGFMPFYPGPGVGGHCIPKDPLYLYWKARRYGFDSHFIKLASRIITYMPEYVVERVIGLLKEKGVAEKKADVLVVGLTYKKDVKDLRQSPALDILVGFQKRGSRVFYHDPLIPYLKVSQFDLKSVDLNSKNIGKFDCVVIATDHSSLDYQLILKSSRFIFDTRNVFKGVNSAKVARL